MIRAVGIIDLLLVIDDCPVERSASVDFRHHILYVFTVPVQVLLLKLAGKRDNLLAEHYQLHCGLFSNLDSRGQCARFSPKLALDSLYRLVVIVADSLELVVEIGQADVVIHRCLIDFYHLDFTSEKHRLDKFSTSP